MRIKKFVDKTMSRLLAQIKLEMGDEALILSTAQVADGYIEILAAIEDDGFVESYEPQYDDALLRSKLSQHGFQDDTLAMLLSTCRQYAAQYSLNVDAEILNKVFDDTIAYYNIFESKTPKLFAGMHGCGKTSTLVKVAIKAREQGREVAIVDMGSRGGQELKFYAKALGADFVAPSTVEEMANAALSFVGDGKIVLIDTLGTNPFIADSLGLLSEVCQMIRVDKYLVWDSVYNVADSVKAAKIFATLGFEKLVPTKLDLAYSLGGLISLAYSCKLELGFACLQANITKGLVKVDNKALTRLLLA